MTTSTRNTGARWSVNLGTQPVPKEILHYTLLCLGITLKGVLRIHIFPWQVEQYKKKFDLFDEVPGLFRWVGLGSWFSWVRSRGNTATNKGFIDVMVTCMGGLMGETTYSTCILFIYIFILYILCIHKIHPDSPTKMKAYPSFTYHRCQEKHGWRSDVWPLMYHWPWFFPRIPALLNS